MRRKTIATYEYIVIYYKLPPIPYLCEGKEHDHKHEHVLCEIGASIAQRGSQQTHTFVEAQQLKELDRRKCDDDAEETCVHLQQQRRD